MIVTFGGEKGGTSKSMLCVNMATQLIHKGFSVAILDCDPKPASSTWCIRRQRLYDDFIENQDDKDPIHKKLIVRKLIPRPISHERVKGDIIRTVESMSRDFDFILIDAGGFDGKEQRTSMILSDKVIFPLRSEQFDLDTVPNLIRIFKESNIGCRGALQGLFVITQAPTNIQLSDDIQEVKNYLSAVEEIPLSNVVMHTRTSYSKSVRSGLGVIEWSDTKSRSEMSLLCKEIFNV